MKKGLVIISLVAIYSCGKEHCYQCKEVTSIKDVIAPSTYGAPFEKCGFTKSEIKKYKKDSYQDLGNAYIEVECSEE